MTLHHQRFPTGNPFESNPTFNLPDGTILIYRNGTDNYKRFLRCSGTDDQIELERRLGNITEPEDIGLFKRVNELLKAIDSGCKPQPRLFLADFGHGKTYSLLAAQNRVIKKEKVAIISYSIGADGLSLTDKTLTDYLTNRLDSLADELNKISSGMMKKRETAPASFDEVISFYDDEFEKIGLILYIMVDELDKIVIGNSEEKFIRQFFEDLKILAENSKKSIHIFLAGSLNCEAKIKVLGRDYYDRYKPISISNFDGSETRSFIRSKCLRSVKKPNLIPFTAASCRLIQKYTNGNPRYIDRVCHDLWNYNSDQKITKKLLQSFIKENLHELIKAEVSSDYQISTDSLELLKEMVATETKISKRRLESILPRGKTILKEFTELESRKILDKIGTSFIFPSKRSTVLIRKSLGTFTEID